MPPCRETVRVVMAIVLLALFVPAASGKPTPPPAEAAAVIQTGRAPCGLAVHGGSLWVGVYEAGSVLRLDPAGRVVQRIRVGRYPCRLAVDDRALWVARDNANRVLRIDRATGGRRAVAISSPFDLLLAAGSLWVASFETGVVTRLDPATARTTRVYEVGGHPSGVAFCAGRIWVGHSRDATWVTAIDPRTGRAERVDVVVPTPRRPQCIRGELWVTTEREVLRVAPRSEELLAHHPLGNTLAEAAPAPDSTIWVTDKERSRVHRVHPATGFVDSFPAGPGAYALARFAGSMWITSFAGSDVRRYDP
jgi:virginiamycin B lyase